MNISKLSKRILFVGNGTWPQKVGKTLLAQGLIQEPSFISAREFATGSSLDVSNYDLIWVATTPKLQLQALEQMGNFSGKIMLEKPLGQSKSEFTEIVNIIKNQKNLIFLSQPWTFRASEKLDHIMLNVDEVRKIDIVRSGNVKREYINEWLDWAPHDLFLLAKYLPYQLINFSTYEPPNSLISELGTLNISLLSGLRISLSAGFTNERRSEWNFEFSNGEIQKLDLLSATNNLRDNSLDSIGLMFDSCFNTESNPTLINQLDWQGLSLNQGN